jgi:fatty acid desaturase
MAFGIVVLATLYLVMGTFQILWGIGASTVGSLSWLSGLLFSQNMREWGGQAFWGGVWGVGGGMLQLITAFGLFARQKWAWLLAWISAAIGVFGPLMALFGGNFWAIFGLIIPGIIFGYLTFNKNVRRTFGVA